MWVDHGQLLDHHPGLGAVDLDLRTKDAARRPVEVGAMIQVDSGRSSDCTTTGVAGPGLLLAPALGRTAPSQQTRGLGNRSHQPTTVRVRMARTELTDSADHAHQRLHTARALHLLVAEIHHIGGLRHDHRP